MCSEYVKYSLGQQHKVAGLNNESFGRLHNPSLMVKQSLRALKPFWNDS